MFLDELSSWMFKVYVLCIVYIGKVYTKGKKIMDNNVMQLSKKNQGVLTFISLLELNNKGIASNISLTHFTRIFIYVPLCLQANNWNWSIIIWNLCGKASYSMGLFEGMEPCV